MKYLFVGALLPVVSFSAIVEGKNGSQTSIAPFSVITDSSSDVSRTTSAAATIRRAPRSPIIFQASIATPISSLADTIPVRPPWTIIPSPVTEPTKPYAPPARLPDIALKDVLGTDNLYHDDLFGIAAVYPDRWTVLRAHRWGVDNRENTVTLAPPAGSTVLSMYYQMYPNGYPQVEGPEAYFRRVAQNKENQRVAAANAGPGLITDYKNVPSSFEFRQVSGNPSMSYFATFKMRNEVHMEYFTWVLGKKGYVMFFTKGLREDIMAIMPQISQMAASVTLP